MVVWQLTLIISENFREVLIISLCNSEFIKILLTLPVHKFNITSHQLTFLHLVVIWEIFSHKKNCYICFLTVFEKNEKKDGAMVFKDENSSTK